MNVRVVVVLVALVACKQEPDKDYTKRKRVVETVPIDGVHGDVIKVHVNAPEGMKQVSMKGVHEWSPTGELSEGPLIHVRYTLASTAPTDGDDAMKFNDQREASYKKRTLADGFIVTNTPKGND